ncbi:hypothetical protein OOK31_34350 [Streptomyces sp. NBC_00249]|uniref:hypothetical protein n=1 Tax=Streptomyces sp. NBC_00249 TaxID=2975690 RepID=UPI00225B4285|nr:hypothetical protein [Streptomyces sp. NBC_00249]MCX5198910.1 hypothetical protein [Streptomyces sp. NBC_00249]
MSQSHTPRKSWIARHKVLTGCGAVLALVVVGACGGGGTDTAKDGKDAGAQKPAAAGTPGAGKPADPAQSGTPQSGAKPSEEKKKAAIKGSGTFQVGSDVKPGTYRTTGNKGLGCYWERAKDSTGELDSIIANDNVSGTSYVTIGEADKIFKSTGCKDWETVDPKATGTPKTEIPADGGMAKVGLDIAPGTYKSTGPAEGSAGCYWERSKSADHQTDSIIANENPEGPAVVTIAAGDGYFKTTGCAPWKKS